MPRVIFIGILVAIATFGGCATTTKDLSFAPPSSGSRCCKSIEPSSRRSAIVRTASKLIGAKTILVKGKWISYDCAGVTRAVYLAHGIDLYDSGMMDPKANGVRLIHRYVTRHGHFHQGPAVRPGDLIFFDNTWDYNGDGITNDPLTHVGIVEWQDQDGTVFFISRVAGSIERYRMNLGLPHVHRTAEGKILNDFLRKKDIGDPLDTRRLTGELFAAFGSPAGL